MKRNLVIIYGILVSFLLVSIAVLIYLIIKSNQSDLTTENESQQTTSLQSLMPSPSPVLTIPPPQPTQPQPQPTQPQPKSQPIQPQPKPSPIPQRSPILTTQNPNQTQIPINPNQKLPIAANTEPPAIDKELCDLINQHRSTLNLPAVPFSNAAWLVAANHAWDSGNNKQSGSCSLHSWSDRPGAWTGCCYNVSSPNGNCMWQKVKEIAGINSRGYEISAGGGGNMTASSALKMWLGSPLHRDVIENTGMWANKKWTGFGCSVSNGYGHCWFLD